VYKYIFGKPADGLERSVEGEDECEFSSIVFSPSQSRIGIPVDLELNTEEERGLTNRHVNTESTASNSTYLNTERYVPTFR
jgi:hypothetical protein